MSHNHHHNHNNSDDDDEYARRLQEEYRQDFLMRQARKQNTALATAPPEVTVVEGIQRVPEADIVLEPYVVPASPRVDAHGFPASPMGPSVEVAWGSGVQQEEEDEALARRLQAELDDERMARRLQEAERTMGNHRRSSRVTSSRSNSSRTRVVDHQHQQQLFRQQSQQPPQQQQEQPSNPPPRKPKGYHRSSSQHTQRTEPDSSPFHSDDSQEGDTPFVLENERAARRIAQEMDDAEMAQRLALYEQEADARRRSNALEQQEIRQTRSNRLLGRILPLVCCGIAVTVSLLFVLGVFEASDVPFVGDVFGGDDWIDPFQGGGNNGFGGDVEVGEEEGDAPEGPPTNDLMGWSNNGRGISLQILNAMSDDWQDYLGTAIANWERGFPIDPLSLPSRRIEYDYDCDPITGRLKVCNGDYGATRWRGLNELLLSRARNTIVASSAKMNEYYLLENFQRGDQQLYTLCHELGHGFGLPHWDENFFNEDSGNCMDYTNNPGDNKWPDASNFLYLAQIYGGVNTTTGEIVTAREARQEAAARGDPGPSAVTEAVVAGRGDVEEEEEDEDEDDKKNNKKDKKDKNNDEDDRRQRRMEMAATAARSLDTWIAQIEAIEAAEASSQGRGLRSGAAMEEELEQVVSRVEAWQRPDGVRRRILAVNDHAEVHWIREEPADKIDEEEEGVVRLEFYLLAEDEARDGETPPTRA